MSRIEKAIEKASKLRKVSGQVPAVEASHAPGAKPSPSGAKSDLAQLLRAAPLDIDSSCLVSALPGRHPVAEEYKKLKSVILKMTKGETFKNTLLVTSSVSEEGKSMTSINLAVALAKEYDHSVLLIDADLRRPSLHRYFNFEPELGLVQCLKDGVPLNQALVKTGHGKLVVLPAGGVVEDPAELLSSDQMRDLIHEMKTRYPERYVIIDTPPSLLFAEAQALSAVVDGVLFVVREGAAKVSQIKDALDGLRGANLMGVVYNDAFVMGRKKKYYYY